MWLETWRLCRETGGLGPLHLSRPFRESWLFCGSFAVSWNRIQSSASVPSCPKIRKHRPACREEKNRIITWAFATFREAILLSRSRPGLKQSIDVFFVAHVFLQLLSSLRPSASCTPQTQRGREQPSAWHGADNPDIWQLAANFGVTSGETLIRSAHGSLPWSVHEEAMHIGLQVLGAH